MSGMVSISDLAERFRMDRRNIIFRAKTRGIRIMYPDGIRKGGWILSDDADRLFRHRGSRIPSCTDERMTLGEKLRRLERLIERFGEMSRPEICLGCGIPGDKYPNFLVSATYGIAGLYETDDHLIGILGVSG